MENDGKRLLSRRTFLGGCAAAGLATAGVLAGCAKTPETQAAAKPSDWLGKAPTISGADIKETLKTDMLIIGAGNAGMSAAATAADLGLDFILCEKTNRWNTTRHWIGAVNSKYTAAVGSSVDTGKLLNEVSRYASNKCSQEVIRTWIDESAEMVEWLGGIIEPEGQLCVVDKSGDSEKTGGTSFYVPVVQHMFITPGDNPFGGTERNEILEKYINKKGHKISHGHTLVSLVRESENSGRVTGGIFKTDKGYVQITAAKGVLLSTGGYSANPDMVKALAPIIPKCTTMTNYSPANDGLGIKAGLWIGADRDVEGAPMIFDRGSCAPGTDAGYVESNGTSVFPVGVRKDVLNFLGSQPFMKISRNGKRFANESTPYDFICFAAAEQPGGVWAQVFDANVEKDILKFATLGCSKLVQAMVASGAPFDQLFAALLDEGLLFKANTLDELADKLKLTGDAKAAFLKEVERYNSLYDQGVDKDFGKEAYRLSAIRQAPFYGIWFGGTLLTTLNGLKINKDMQVLDTKRKVIEGLYAAGDCSGSFFSGNYPEYIVGVACGRTLTFGRHAAKHIAAS